MIENLFATLLNTRLDELTNSSTPPSHMYSYYGGTFKRTKKDISSNVSRGQTSALKALVTENERAKKLDLHKEN
jgi:zinc protease